MASKKLFGSAAPRKPLAPVADTVNHAGGLAYSLADEAALAQMAATGTFADTFYASGEDQLEKITELANKVSVELLAKVAVYSRENAFMKDSSALLLSVLFARDVELFKKVFNRVVDNGKMLRNFAQIVRSGKAGRKSFGTAGKRAIQNWLNARSDVQLFNDSIGNDPSLADVIKMVHPRGNTPSREAFYAYLLGKEYKNASKEGKESAQLPQIVRDYEAFKLGKKDQRVIPERVNFQMLTALDLSDKEWSKAAEGMGWQATRMNLNTMQRHSVFSDDAIVKKVAAKLASEKDIMAVKAFPYQLLTAFLNADAEVPSRVKNALQDAMEIATKNVPKLKGKVVVAVDSSGSMNSSVTGYRKGATSVVTCNQVASLMAASLMRVCEDTTVMRFDTSAEILNLNARDSVMTNAAKINRSGGGTTVSAPLALMNQKGIKAETVILISDNESWADHSWGNGATALMNEWVAFKKKNPNAKLVLIDITPNTTSQASSRKDILKVGGFSDTVFEVVAAFAENTNNSSEFWLDKINAMVTL